MALSLRTSKKSYRVHVTRGSGEAVFTVDPDTPEEIRDRIERFTTMERVRGETREKIDWYRSKLDRVVKIITGWEGVNDETGEPIPCTRENKIAVYLNNPGVIDEVLAEAEELAQEAGKRAEEQEKNSKIGRKG